MLLSVLLLAAPLAFPQATVASADPATTSAAPASPAPRRMLPLTRETAELRRNNFEQGWPTVEASLKRWSKLNRNPRDFRRVAPSHDFTAYVFTPAERETLEARREQAQREFDGGDWPGAILTYGQLISQANDVVERTRQVGGYWLWSATHERRMFRWRRTVRSNDLANPEGPGIEALESRLEAQIRASNFGEPSRTLMTEIDQRFMRAVQQARMAAPGGQLRHDPLRRTPERPCADGDPDMSLPPAASVMTSARLAQARSRSAREYYPPIARYYDIEGVVTVRVLTSASGCVVSADLQTSSGNELLDDAALDWVVEGAAFEPATDAGLAPIPSIVVLNVRFDLTG